MILQVENPVMEVHDLTVSYANQPVLWGVDFSLPPGVLACVVGPNGAGKSTLLKAVMGLIPIDTGYTRIFGQPIGSIRGAISYVPQRESVDWDFPASVLDVVMMGCFAKLGLFRRPGKAEKLLAVQCLEKVGMQGYMHRQISQLSGGQQQRVFIARALAQQARLYMMDEPFAGVDIATEGNIIQLLKEIKLAGHTVLVVHHDLHTVIDYFDWIILLNTRLIASGPTEQMFTPELLQETYGGKLSVLSMMGDILKEKKATKID